MSHAAGSVGLVTTLFDAALASLRSPLVMMCGPDVMMVNACRDLVARHIDPSDIWLTLERNMKCAVGLCGHCQLGPLFVCKDGPVFRYERVAELLETREV